MTNCLALWLFAAIPHCHKSFDFNRCDDWSWYSMLFMAHRLCRHNVHFIREQKQCTFFFLLLPINRVHTSLLFFIFLCFFSCKNLYVLFTWNLVACMDFWSKGIGHPIYRYVIWILQSKICSTVNQMIFCQQKNQGF